MNHHINQTWYNYIMGPVNAKEYTLWKLGSYISEPTNHIEATAVIQLLNIIKLFNDRTVYPNLQITSEGIFLHWKAGKDFIIIQLAEQQIGVSGRIKEKELYFEENYGERASFLSIVLIDEMSEIVEEAEPLWRKFFNLEEVGPLKLLY